LATAAVDYSLSYGERRKINYKINIKPDGKAPLRGRRLRWLDFFKMLNIIMTIYWKN
jgi:hypothetical protein